MPQATVRVGIIGTGFGQSAMLPGFRYAPGADIVAICSGRRARAEAAAREHGIPHAFDDYRAMLDSVDLDLVAIVTPVHLHHPMTVASLNKGCHVLVEKPTAMDLAEATDMYRRAQAAGVLHLIDHELRFNPTRMRMAQLIQEGYIGRPFHALITSSSGFRADPNAPWSWWSSKAMGGGGVGAAASHQVDLLRWWLGEIRAVSSQVRTFITRRPDPETGAPREVDADDFFVFLCDMDNGAQATVQVSYVTRQPAGPRVEIHGAEGSLVLDNEDRLWGRRAGDSAPTELTLPDPAAELPGIPANVYNRSFVHLAREMVAAIQAGRPTHGGATLWDGAQNQAVLDAIRDADETRRWVDVAQVSRE